MHDLIVGASFLFMVILPCVVTMFSDQQEESLI